MRNWTSVALRAIITALLSVVTPAVILPRAPRIQSHAKSSKAPPPDPQIGQAAVINAQLAGKNADISREMLDFSRQQYADQKAEADKLRPYTEKMMQGQIDMAQQSMDMSKLARQDYETTFRPIEQRFAADSQAAGSAAEQAKIAGQAGTDVQRQLDIQRGASERQMAQMGVNPNSGKFQALNRSNEILGAASKAGTMNAARMAEKNRGDAMRQNAISIGRGLPATALAAQGVANAGVAGAINTGQTGFNMNAAAGGQFMSGLGQGGAMNSSAGALNSSAANILLGQHGAQMSAFNANQQSKNSMMSGVGSAVGMAAMFL